MSRIHSKRAFDFIKTFCLLLVILFLALYALKENIQLYLTPSDWYQRPIYNYFKLGGLVAKDSIKDISGEVRFIITDGKRSIKVKYKGILPSLFKEGKGVIVEGRMNKSHFEAKTVLAKHDENYRPPNVKEHV